MALSEFSEGRRPSPGDNSADEVPRICVAGAYTKCCIVERSVDEILERIVWLGDSLGCVRAFPGPARQDAGFQLDRIQRGLNPRDWKPFTSVGPGVAEIRVHAGGEYRVLYVAKFGIRLRAARIPEEGPENARQRDIACEGALQEPPPERGLNMKTVQTKPNANVFRDLGFPPAEAENLRIRAAMMNALIAEIEKKGLTQAQAAKLLGVTQPRVSDLMRGRLHLFSIDALVNFLGAAGLRVTLRVGRAA